MRPCPAPLLAGLLALSMTSLWPLAGRAENWPQWRGPTLNGASPETGLPARWSPTENTRWVADLPGPASSTPVVWDGRVFVSTVDRQTRNVLGLCLDAATGRERWRAVLCPDRKANVGANNMASPSPVTDGQRVCFLSGSGLLSAFDMDGAPLWSADLEKAHGEFVVKWGYSSSPLLQGGRLYVPVLQNPGPGKYHASERTEALASFLLAVDVQTGRELWKHVRPTDATDESAEAYLTPVPFESGGRAEIVLAGGEHVTGHDPGTGAELWRWPFSPADRQVWQRVVASPVTGDGRIYVCRPKMRPVYAVKGGATGPVGDDWLAWRRGDITSDCASPLFYRDRLYVLDGDKRVLYALDPSTGTTLWQGELKTKTVLRASPLGADGRIYCLSEGGEVVVVNADAPFTEVFRTELRDGPCRAGIVAANGCLYVRTASRLHALGPVAAAPAP